MKANNAMMSPETLMKYASVLRIPREIALPVIRDFLNNRKNCGDEWTCSRFKSVKLDFIRSKAGLPLCSQWISKRGNHFKGSFGGLQTWCNKSYKRWSKAIQLLQIYSTLYAPAVTEAQSQKFCDAVNKPSELKNFDVYEKLLLKAVNDWFPKSEWYPDPESLLKYPVSSTKREPHASGVSYPEGENTLECARSFLDNTAYGLKLVEDFPNLFGGVLQDIGYLDSEKRFYCKNTKFLKYTFTAGKIGLIQEPGYKLRAVANPARVFQAALKPLGDSLYRKLSMLPWDCTFDQNKPFVTIQRALQQGVTCHAVDLSNATDMFPLAFQLSMLNKLFARKDAIQLFEFLSRAEWWCELTPTRRISWKGGQPLGLYPSFASFAMCHGMILYALNNFCHSDKFFVLGDDVVILDELLHTKYMLFLAQMHIPYAASKTLSSSLLTEFGGKIITPDAVMHQLKWRHVSDDSFIDLARNIGDRFRLLMKPRQRVIFDMVKSIPEFLGGCGFNPQGLPLSTRVQLYLTLLSEDKQSFLLSYNGRLQQMNYAEVTHSTGMRWYYTKSPVEAFEQNAAHFALRYVPVKLARFIPVDKTDLWRQTFGNLLYTAFPRERCMPIAGTSVRTSTLEVLERKLRK